MNLELKVQKREKFGRAVKADRQLGWIPAELYGHGLQNLHLNVPQKDFSKVFKVAGENSVVNVLLDSKKYPVLIHDVQRDPVSDEPLNIDFYQVKLDEKIKVKVPIEFTGVAPAVKDFGGILVKAVHEIEVEALPMDLPHSLSVDLSVIKEIGHSVYIKDIKIPAGAKLHINPETVVASVIAKLTEEQEAALSQVVDVTGVKVETEEKKAEREAVKATTATVGAPATAAKPAAGAVKAPTEKPKK